MEGEKRRRRRRNRPSDPEALLPPLCTSPSTSQDERIPRALEHCRAPASASLRSPSFRSSFLGTARGGLFSLLPFLLSLFLTTTMADILVYACASYAAAAYDKFSRFRSPVIPIPSSSHAALPILPPPAVPTSVSSASEPASTVLTEHQLRAVHHAWSTRHAAVWLRACALLDAKEKWVCSPTSSSTRECSPSFRRAEGTPPAGPATSTARRCAPFVLPSMRPLGSRSSSRRRSTGARTSSGDWAR